MNRQFPIKIDNGKVKDLDRDSFNGYLATLKNGDYYIVIEKPKRSNQANAYLWGVVYKAVSDELGWDIDDVHSYCKMNFNPIHKIIGDEETTIAGSTAKLNSTQFFDYVEKIRQYFAERVGLYIPDPQEYSVTETNILNQ